MARKFNNGRLGEQLMNKDLFLAYNRIKYIGNGPNVPVQERQAAIPDYSLWIDRKTGYDVMKVWDQVKWSPLFEGYYHPANVAVQPENPVEGQLYIDTNGVLRYYQDNQWRVVAAASASNLSSMAAGVSNFLIMPDMTTLTGVPRTYVVPLITTGKLFDDQKYVSRAEFEGTEMQIRYPLADGSSPNGKVSWVHVNPTFLFNANKRLIKVIDKVDYFINAPTTNTEFYGFKLGSPVGTFLRHIEDFGTGDITSDINDTISDYRHVSGGIQLINNGRNYDYIYAITYKFDSVDNTYGTVLTGNATIGSENDVYVGQLEGFPLVFLDGTYMEQSDYEYDKTEGMLHFSGEEITNESDLVVAAFADIILGQDGTPFDFEVSASDINSDGNIVYTHEYIKNAAKFTHPIVFVQGIGTLYDEEYGMTDEVELNTSTGTVTVKNFGPIASDDTLKICIADIGTAKLSSGTVTSSGEIVDPNITIDKQYLAFVNGICTSPSDHEVFDGKLKIDKADDVAECEYYLMSLDKGDEGIDLMFDSSISYFTLQIQDNSQGVVYNDCDMVESYVYDPSNRDYNGILIDYNHIESAITGEKAYVTGEILKVQDTDNSDPYNYEYKIYNVNGDYRWTDYDDQFGIDERNKLENMITQFKGDGSISIMSNKELEGKVIEYYAYTYADEVDEPILKGSKNNYKIAVKNHMADAGITSIQNFSVSRTQLYTPPNKGILGTYINGIQIRSIDDITIDNTSNCKFTIDTAENLSFNKKWGTKCDLYPLLKRIDDSTSLIELEQLKAGEFATELKDYSITVELLNKLKLLSAIIQEAETNNELFYYVEKLERGETYSVNRDWLGHGNRFDSMDNSYTAISYIGPGLVDIYLNGVMLDRSSYSLFNNNYVLLNDLTVAGGSDEYDKDKEETHRMIKYYIEEFNKDTGETSGRIERVYCESPDELLIEYRPDVTLRKTSYEIKESTYDMNGVFSYDDYEFPASLLNTKDEIKIWIDGILYTGGYYIEGKNIVLKNSPLRLDPIKEYFNSHPDTYRDWKKLHGEYSYTRSRVIFEWR